MTIGLDNYPKIVVNILTASPNKIIAKIFFNVVTGRLCVSFAPNGTVMKVPTTMPISAGRYTYPIVWSGKSLFP